MDELLVQEIDRTIFPEKSTQLEQLQNLLQQQTEELAQLKSERDWLEAQLQAWIQTAQNCLEPKVDELNSNN